MELMFINIGHLHPVVVHLPIGILLFAALLFFAGVVQRTDQYWPGIRLALAASIGGALLAILSGWLLSDGAGYDETLLFRHKYLGIATAVGALCLLLLSLRERKSSVLFGALMLIVVVLLSITGHIGGTMTHGQGYLFEVEAESLSVAEIASVPVYQAAIAPLLNRKCTGCHNATKRKGGLLLSDVAGLLAGGDHGSVLPSGNGERGTFINRLHLPKADEEHMPPTGKAQLTPDEIQLLEWWIENNACDTCNVLAMSNNEAMQPVYERYVLAQAGSRIPALKGEQIAVLQALDIDVSSWSESSPMVSVSIENKEGLTSNQLDALEDIAENLRYLSLAGTPLTSNDLSVIGGLENLEELYLQQTGIESQQLKDLANLQQLQVLNLYGNRVSDSDADRLLAMAELHTVYLWQTDVTDNIVDILRSERPGMEVNIGADQAVFGDAQLNPPKLTIRNAIFEDTLTVGLFSNVVGASIFYTLDGSTPTSNSTRYTAPFVVADNVELQAIAVRDGWQSSSAVRKKLLRASVAVTKATLAAAPDDRYAATGAAALIDHVQSAGDFADGKWLGWQGADVGAVLELENAALVSGVNVRCLSAPDSWIHYPKGISVELSMDGQNFAESTEIQLDSDVRSGVEARFFQVDVEPQQAKYVRVGVRSQLKNPSWHPVPEGDCWLFLDEIVLN